jgi:hypothetical protein
LAGVLTHCFNCGAGSAGRQGQLPEPRQTSKDNEIKPFPAHDPETRQRFSEKIMLKQKARARLDRAPVFGA